jgi:hypothetical protein
MIKKIYIWAIISLLFGQSAGAGETNDDEHNLQLYTPSALLDKQQIEFKHFNNVYTQTSQFTNAGSTVNIKGRKTYFTSINQFLYGLSPMINIGFDLWVKSVRFSENASDSPFHVLRFKNGRYSRTAITGLGPKFKIAPFRQWAGFSIQSTLLFPLEKDLESTNSNRPFLENDRILWLTQFFYDQRLNDDFQLFFQLAPWVSFVRKSYRQNNALETPVSGFINYFLNNKVTLYAMTEYWPSHYNVQDQSFALFHSYFIQSGIGGKYQLIPGTLEVELLYADFWLGSEGQGAGHSFNIGLRLLN